MIIRPLSSGSKGNSLFVECGDTRLLVDAGLSCKELTRRMLSADIDPESLDAILVTHEHGDHIGGISVLSRKYRLPIWVSKGTWEGIRLNDPNWHLVNLFDKRRAFRLGGLTIQPVGISHDTLEPVAFSITNAQTKFSVATDLGRVTNDVVEALSGSDALFIESNHDIRMLRDGPYPIYLKRRVESNRGHLSNRQSVNLISRVLHGKLQAIYLGHLSETNNTPEIAFDTMMEFLADEKAEIPLLIANQYEPSEALFINE